MIVDRFSQNCFHLVEIISLSFVKLSSSSTNFCGKFIKLMSSQKLVRLSSSLCHFIFQSSDITDPYTGRWIRFFPRTRTTSLHWTCRWTQSRSSEIQFLHIRIRFGIGEIGFAVGIRTTHKSNMSTSSWRSFDWWKCNRYGMGTIEWRWYIAVSFTRGGTIWRKILENWFSEIISRLGTRTDRQQWQM